MGERAHGHRMPLVEQVFELVRGNDGADSVLLYRRVFYGWKNQGVGEVGAFCLVLE